MNEDKKYWSSFSFKVLGKGRKKDIDYCVQKVSGEWRKMKIIAFENYLQKEEKNIDSFYARYRVKQRKRNIYYCFLQHEWSRYKKRPLLLKTLSEQRKKILESSIVFYTETIL